MTWMVSNTLVHKHTMVGGIKGAYLPCLASLEWQAPGLAECIVEPKNAKSEVKRDGFYRPDNVLHLTGYVQENPANLCQ
jgi:hypothetical protein